MNKSDLTKEISSQTGQTAAAVGEVLASFESIVVSTVKDGGKVQLPGFLSFEKGHRKARVGRNPQTGAEVQIRAADVPKVKVGKSFKDAVNTL
ncbi:MAG TPA: HU family DNA-binding protein [Acidimicrobiales bacterium]|jgi:DNA-binding protein HU-beta